VGGDDLTLLMIGARFAVSAVHATPGPGERVAPVQTTIAQSELDVRASLQVFERSFIEALIPVRYASLRAADLHGTERLAGIGDVELGVRHRLLGGAFERGLLDARLAVSLPFGGIAPGPYAPSPEGVLRQPYFFGRGTFDPVVGLQGSLQASNLRLVGFAWAKTSLYDNAYGFRGGARLSAGGGVEAGPDSWKVTLLGSVYHEAPDRWSSGVPSEYSGHSDVAALLGVQLLRASEWPIELSILLPLTLRSASGEYHSPATFALAIEHAFAI
jgi:hypothetical protein